MKCPKCSYETALKAMRCPECTSVFELRALEEHAHLGYLQSKLSQWAEDDMLPIGLTRAASQLVEEERKRLGRELGLERAATAVPEPTPLSSAREARGAIAEQTRGTIPPEETPSPAPGFEISVAWGTLREALPRFSWSGIWSALLSERALNAVIYIAAFLVVAALAAFVILRWDALSAGVQLAMLAAITAAFYAAGYWVKMRLGLARAGTGLLVTASAIVAIDVVAITRAGPFELSVEGTWAATSVIALPFFVGTFLLFPERPFAVLAVIAGLSAPVSVMTAAGIDLEWQCIALVATMIVYVLAASQVERGRMEKLRLPLLWVSHAIVPGMLLATLGWKLARINGADLVPPLDHSPNDYALAIGWWLGVGAYAAASYVYFRRAYWSYATAAMALTAYYLSAELLLDLEPHDRGLFALAPAFVLVAAAEIVARWRAADLPKHWRDTLPLDALRGEHPWALATLPLLVGGYMAAAVAVGFVSFDLANSPGEEAKAVASYGALFVLFAASAFLRRSETFAHLAAWLLPVPFFVAASDGFFAGIELRQVDHAWILVLFAPAYLMAGTVLDRLKDDYGRAAHIAAFLATVVAMAWSAPDGVVAFRVMGVALAVYVASALLEYRGSHPVLTWTAEQAAALTPPAVRWVDKWLLPARRPGGEPLPEAVGLEVYRSLFVHLVAIILPIWISVGLSLLDVTYSYYGLAFALLAALYVAFALFARKARPAYTYLPLAVGYTLSAIGPLVAIPRQPVTVETEGVFVGILAISGGLYATSALAYHRGWWLYPVAAVLPALSGLILLGPGVNLGADLSGPNVSYDLFFGPALAALGLLYIVIPPMLRSLRYRTSMSEPHEPGSYATPFCHLAYPIGVAGMVSAGLLAIPESHDIGVASSTAIPLLVAMGIAVAQYAASAVVLRQGFWMYPAAVLMPLILTFTLLEIDADPPAFGIAMAALALAYVVAPPMARYLSSRIPVWARYGPGEFSLPLYLIAYPMAIGGMAAAARLALADPETADFQAVASVPLLIAMGLALGQYAVSAVVLRDEVWLYLANAMAPLVTVFSLAHFRVDPPLYGVALAAMGLAYTVLPLIARRAYAGLPLREPFRPGRYSLSFCVIGHVLALAGMAVAGALAATAEGQTFDSIPLIIAMSLALALYVASAVTLREGRWMYAAAVLLPVLGGFIIERMDVPPEWYGVALVALACVYVLGPQLVDFSYRRVRAVARPFQVNPYSRPLLEVGYVLSGIGIVASAAADEIAGITALSLAGTTYLVSAYGLRRREFLHAAAVAWSAAYIMGLTLTPLEARHYGLAIMGASTLALAAAPLLKWSWQRAGPASTEEAPWHEKAPSIAGSPAAALYAVAYAGIAASVILTWVDAGTWQDNPLLMTTLAWAAALLAYSTWVFRASGFLWAALISADLASVAGMWYANPNMTSGDMAIWLTPASYALALGAAWTWRLAEDTKVKPRGDSAVLERVPAWLPWVAPFLTIALAHILASLAMTAGDSEAGLVVALAYFVLLAAASFVTSLEALAWGAMALGAIAFGHGMNLASVEAKAGILYAALAAAAVRGAGYLAQRTLDLAGDQAWLRPLRAWQRPLTLGSYIVTAGTFLAAVAVLQREGDLVSPTTQWPLATMFVAGLNLSIAALAERRAWLAYLGSGLIVAAALLEAVHFELDQPQIYVLPVGLYLLAVGQLERQRLGWLLTMPLVGTALILLLGTTLLQSWGLLGAEGQEVMYGLAYVSESLLVLAWGILQRARLSFFTGIASTIAAALTLILRSTIPAASALDVDQLAMIFGGLGAGLLALAVYLERRREILLVQGREWLARIENWS
jgi:hypothetical protein